ncbi:MAG: type VI secretion system baseplate subunit TssE [Bryobacteraceae bacterium]|nr:type VI secretion system baseplate subunit TssE [Bryobacteraceae bacterium]
MPPPRQDPDQAVTLPLLDRLTNTPDLNAPLTRGQSVRLLRASLRRDLEWLFNSRANHELNPRYAEVFQSVVNYGLPDVSNLSMANFRDRQRLERYIEQAIATFEPRLTAVQVRMVDHGADGAKKLRFQIDALLKMDPAPERVSFDTVLDVLSGEYQVKGEASAG